MTSQALSSQMEIDPSVTTFQCLDTQQIPTTPDVSSSSSSDCDDSSDDQVLDSRPLEIGIKKSSAPKRVPLDNAKPDRPAKKRRVNKPFDEDPTASYHVLIIKNFTTQQFDHLKEDLEDAISEFEEDRMETDPVLSFMEIDPRRIIVKQSDEEKKLKKKQYRDSYIQRPEVKEKKAQKEADPATKEKRKAYSKQPKVIEQKQFRVQVRQTVNKTVKQQMKPLWERLEREAIPIVKEKLQKKKATQIGDVSASADSQMICP